MNFSDFFNEGKDSDEQEIQKEKPKKKKSVEELFKENDIKIKITIPTSFGTEYVLYKKYSESELKKIFKDYKIQVKNYSIFI